MSSEAALTFRDSTSGRNSVHLRRGQLRQIVQSRRWLNRRVHPVVFRIPENTRKTGLNRGSTRGGHVVDLSVSTSRVALRSGIRQEVGTSGQAEWLPIGSSQEQRILLVLIAEAGADVSLSEHIGHPRGTEVRWPAMSAIGVPPDIFARMAPAIRNDRLPQCRLKMSRGLPA
jgi:hypothetical protein